MRKTKMLMSGAAIAVISAAILMCGGCQNSQKETTAATAQVETAAQTEAESTTEETTAAEEKSETAGNTVIDAANREVEIPEKVEHVAITCNGGTTQEVAILGNADMIVAQPSMKKFPMLLKMYPQFKDITDGGSFDKVNVEELMNTNPDLVLVGVSSEKGNAQIEDAGMKTYTMLIGWAGVDSLKQEFLNMGKILGNEKKAQLLVDHWNTTLSNLDEMLSKVPENERKTVYYTGSEITKANTGDWGRSWIAGSGGIFAVPEGIKGEISVEQVMEWNPDVIVTQGGNGTDGLLNNESVQDITAIKNKEVYECPIGAFWWDRPSPESTLGFLWLAKTLYPDYTQEIDLKQEAKDFFQTFYEYDLTDEDYESFFFQ